MPIQFLRRNPVISSFQSGMQEGQRERTAEEQDFQRRFDFQRSVGTDKALRAGLGSFYATQDPAVAAAAPVAAAPAVGAPGGAMSPMDAPDMGEQVPVPVGPGGVPSPQPAAGAPAPAQPAPAPAGAPRRPPSRFAPVMGELAKTPGAGQAMLQLFTRDQADQTARATQDRAMRAEGSKLMLQALKDGDVPMAKAYSQQYGVPIPDEVWKNRDVLMGLRTAANLAKTLGIKDEHAVAFSQGYVQARSAGQPDDQAMLAGLKAVPRDGFEVKGHFTDDKNQVQFYDKGGNLKPSGAKARPPAGRTGAGGAGGSTATIQNREDMLKRLKVAYPGIDDQLAQKLVINPRATITPQDVVKQRNALQNMKDNLGRPLYKTTTELDNAVRQVLEGARQMAGFTQAAPQPTPGPAPAAAPAGPGGAKKRMRFNPRTQQLEEVTG